MKDFWEILQKNRMYAVSSKGIVRNLHTGKSLKWQYSVRGGMYPFIRIRVNGRKKNLNIHKLVADAFLRTPDRIEGRVLIDHKDNNRNNPSVENLEWVTHKENARRREMFKKRNP